jgi:two-component system sensor histidine kinase KdpD
MSRASRRRVRAYLVAAGTVAVATLVGMAADAHVSQADQAMLYLLAILFAALGGRGPGIAAAALSVASFDFFFVPPRYTFAVADLHSLITFGVMFAIGTAIGSLVARLRDAEEASRDREGRTAALLAFTRDAAAAADVEGVRAAVITHVRGVAGAACEVIVPDEPLRELRIRIADERALTPEQHQFVEAVARQAGVAVGRLQLAATARDAALRAKAEELRSTLLSTVSHDLRTPLAVITGMATTLRDDATGDRREALDTIVDEAERLSRILTNLLAITKVESGAAPRREWVPFEELVGAALGRLDQALAAHPVAVDVPPTALAHVDAILVEQLLINLLDNAAKHTPAGTAIEVAASRDTTGATLEIRDRGPGLPAGPPRQVFDKFFRGEHARAGGVGLGLAVCRGIALAHQGTIDAVRRDGGGATFRVWFPDDGHPPDVSEDEPLAEAG